MFTRLMNMFICPERVLVHTENGLRSVWGKVYEQDGIDLAIIKTPQGVGYSIVELSTGLYVNNEELTAWQAYNYKFDIDIIKAMLESIDLRILQAKIDIKKALED